MPMQCIMPVNDILDIAGPMAKIATDIANVFDLMVNGDSPKRPSGGYASKVTGSWDGLRLGAVETANWRLDEVMAVPNDDWFEQQVEAANFTMEIPHLSF